MLIDSQSVYGRAVEEMRALLSKRESDVVRLREQRDQQHAELNERKQKDSVKQHSKQELRNLAESHAVSSMSFCEHLSVVL